MILKKCKHGRGLTGAARLKAWRKCGCAWMASINVDGVRAYVNLGTIEADAEAQYLRLKADNIDGRVLRRRPGRGFSDVATSYLAELTARNDARPNRIRTTTSRVERLKVYWEDNPVDGITLDAVRVFIGDMQDKYAPNTGIAIYSTFRSVLKHAQKHGLVEALPLPEGSGIPKTNSRQANHLTLPETVRLIAALPTPYDAMCEFALLTGMRVGEIAALQTSDFDRERKVVHVRGTLAHDGTVGPPKTHQGVRAIPLSKRAFQILSDQADQRTEGFLFPVTSLAMCGFVMRKTLIKLKLWRPGRGWHALRHAHTAILEASGMGIRDAAARLGHGANFIQTAAYGWAAEAGDATTIDSTLARLHDGTSAKGRTPAQGSE